MGAIDRKGYVRVYAPNHPLTVGKTHLMVAEHRVVLYDTIGVGPHPCHWCGKPGLRWDDGTLCADHVNHIRWDNIWHNLVPSCRGCNVRRHKPKIARRRGEQHPWHKLTKEQVRRIRMSHAKGRTQRALAEQYGVNQSTISDIVHRRTW